MNVLFHPELVSLEKKINIKIQNLDFQPNCHLDLSGLTLQSGPSRIIKDEYTPGGSLGNVNLELDGNEIGTIQHHPIHMPGMGYSSMSAMHQQPGSGKTVFTIYFSSLFRSLNHNFLLAFLLICIFFVLFQLFKIKLTLKVALHYIRRVWCQK